MSITKRKSDFLLASVLTLTYNFCSHFYNLMKSYQRLLLKTVGWQVVFADNLFCFGEKVWPCFDDIVSHCPIISRSVGCFVFQLIIMIYFLFSWLRKILQNRNVRTCKWAMIACKRYSNFWRAIIKAQNVSKKKYSLLNLSTLAKGQKMLLNLSKMTKTRYINNTKKLFLKNAGCSVTEKDYGFNCFLCVLHEIKLYNSWLMINSTHMVHVRLINRCWIPALVSNLLSLLGGELWQNYTNCKSFQGEQYSSHVRIAQTLLCMKILPYQFHDVNV